jgi:hypothetical protein
MPERQCLSQKQAVDEQNAATEILYARAAYWRLIHAFQIEAWISACITPRRPTGKIEG